ncbi:hypothetical protein cce_1552 [Crocosphaera subtropica ATCC 51142]|uniref:Polymer-forming cytoskeletal protein n=1 Tax=Crocosphaera subtropica (strain ATCC 51142 / BH68) TaxID=43989 RepID=B1WXR5_CROS5|nr:hypothetical protein [Crocosphaera subtropica]ACB50902.1 hypothetical protein cce_1552 [Crocosphaera subtropica ATCC 51142]
MKRSSVAIRQKLLILVSLVLLVGLFLVSSLGAMKNRRGEQITIAQNEIIDDDLYVFGAMVTIDGTVRGDVIGAGRQITVNGTVEGDLVAAGQAIVINGTVNDDARIAGQVLQIGTNARIADDLVAAGGSFESKTGSTIAGDLSFAAAQARLMGTVQQQVKGTMAALELGGTVGQNMNVTIGSDRPLVDPPFTPPSPVAIPVVATGLTITDFAQIGGELNYRSGSEATISSAAQIAGGVNREGIKPATARHTVEPALVVWGNVQRWITLFLVGVLGLWLVPGWIQQLGTTVQAKPLPSLGWGIVTGLIVGTLAIAVPVITIILTAILGSFLWNLVPLIMGVGLLTNSILVIGFLLFISYVPPIVVSFLGGQWLLHSVKGNGFSKRIVKLAVGLLIFVFLSAIPLLGGLIYLIVILLGLGSLWILLQNRSPSSLNYRENY